MEWRFNGLGGLFLEGLIHGGAYLRNFTVAFASIQKPFRIGLLFTHKNGDFGAISVTARSFHAPISKWKVTYRIGVHTIPHGLSCRHKLYPL